jgi:serine/threonine-protein kinase
MPIAQGGMSEVWLARAKGARGFQQLFAVKALLPAHASNPELVTMFLDEARIASKIRHPNVVGILDLGEHDGALFLAMEWVEGETVAALLRRGPVPLRVATRIVLDVCRAAHAAHELRDEDGRPYGLVHRDISPQNILLSPGGAIKLTDFGVLKASIGRELAETLPGRVKGKAAYMAPEQILDSRRLDRRGDVFALGVVLYRLAVGEHPFRGKNDVETMTNVVRAALPAELPIERDPDLLSLAALLRKALSKKPDDRFATAADMAEALEALGPAAAPASPDEVIAYVREAAGAQVRARRKLVLRTLQELDGAPAADPRPSGDATSLPALVTSAARLPAAAPVAEAPSSSDVTPAPVTEFDLAPGGGLKLVPSRRRLRWREQAKGAAFAALALVAANVLFNAVGRAPAGRGEPATHHASGGVTLAPGEAQLVLAAPPPATVAPARSARPAGAPPKDEAAAQAAKQPGSARGAPPARAAAAEGSTPPATGSGRDGTGARPGGNGPGAPAASRSAGPAGPSSAKSNLNDPALQTRN